MERAAEIYKNIANEDSKGAETAVSLSVKRVDYMSIYASNLVAAVRRAAGNIGTFYHVSGLMRISMFRGEGCKSQGYICDGCSNHTGDFRLGVDP